MLSRKSATLQQSCAWRRPAAASFWLALWLAIAATSVDAHTFCVSKISDFTDPEHALVQAFAAAGDGGAYNGENNTVRIVRGTYSMGGLTPEFDSSSTHTLDINGGYNSDCSTIVENPALTILDGGGQAKLLFTRSSGDVSIRWLTLQNGYASTSVGGALSMVLTSMTSEVILEYNIIRNNTAPGGANYAGGLELVGTGLTYIENNVFAGNSAPGFVSAIYISLANSTVYFVNNTISQNISTSITDSYAVWFAPGDSVTAYVSNNIIWGNTDTYDIGFYTNNVQLIDNDYASIDSGSTPAPGSGGTQNVDPQFVGNGSFRLSTGSLLLGTGTLTPPGGLPTIDMDGNPRSFNSQVDLGAYERGNEIFKNSFDN